MSKNKFYYLRIAIIKTMLSGFLYLMMPVAATLYNSYIPKGYIGYTVLGSGIMMIGNIILLVWAWVLVFDRQTRKNHLKED